MRVLDYDDWLEVAEEDIWDMYEGWLGSVPCYLEGAIPDPDFSREYEKYLSDIEDRAYDEYKDSQLWED